MSFFDLLIGKPQKMRIVFNGHPALRRQSLPVGAIDNDVKAFAERLLVSLAESEVPGVGLAAPQVGVNLRMVAIDTRPDPKEAATMTLSPGELVLNPKMPLVLVNPEIISRSEETTTREEGCLSLPGVEGDVTRPAKVVLRATLTDGSQVVLECANLLARCLQHEIDHLDGVLFIDHSPKWQQKEARKTMTNLERQEKLLESKEN